MRCEKALRRLSPYLDGILESDAMVEVSRHLNECRNCNGEYERLKKLQQALRNFAPARTPDYLYSLVALRIHSARQATWRQALQSAWEYRWSRIRTTGVTWYLTRLMGSLATVVLFITISSAMNPIYLGYPTPAHQENKSGLIRSQQFVVTVLKNLGLKGHRVPVSRSDPKINGQYFLNFVEETASRPGHDDTMSVDCVVDSYGSLSVQGVLEYPTDPSLLHQYIDMIMSARFRPASQNGKAVDSRLVLTYSKIYVYD